MEDLFKRFNDAARQASEATRNLYAILYACGAEEPIPLTAEEIKKEIASARHAKDEARLWHFLKLRRQLPTPNSTTA